MSSWCVGTLETGVSIDELVLKLVQLRGEFVADEVDVAEEEEDEEEDHVHDESCEHGHHREDEVDGGTGVVGVGEDFSGQVVIRMTRESYDKFGNVLQTGRLVKIRGTTVSDKDGCMAVQASHVEPAKMVHFVSINSKRMKLSAIQTDAPLQNEAPKDLDGNISRVARFYGVIVIRQDKCLLIKSEDTFEGYTFPSIVAERHEGPRAAALHAFEYWCNVDEQEIRLLNYVQPVYQYHPKTSTKYETIAELHLAYANSPPPENSTRPSNGDDLGELYEWMTYEEAIQALEPEEEKLVLKQAVHHLHRAKREGLIGPNFGKWFGPEEGVEVRHEPFKHVSENLRPRKHESDEIIQKARLAQVAAAFYMQLNEDLNDDELSKVLGRLSSFRSPPPNSQVEQANMLTKKKPELSRKLPATVLSGFLGAGKTTILESILKREHGQRIAVIVNDMSEVNIDYDTIKLVHSEEMMVEMSNGCICCTLREDLLVEIAKLAREGRFDYLLIESSGISEPLPVAETFTFTDDLGQSLSDVAKLDTLVTVVDATSFLRDLNDSKTSSLADRGLETSPEDKRHISDLLIDQVEFANVIVISKCDLVPSEEELVGLTNMLTKLNPKARIIRSIKGNVPLHEILNTDLFSFETAQENPGWLQELRGTHTPETEEYGISSFVYRACKPFHPRRLREIFDKAQEDSQSEENPLKALVRSKGVAWIATHEGWENAVIWSHAGHRFLLHVGEPWWVTRPQNTWPGHVHELFNTRYNETGEIGDRQTEIVLIGVNMDETKIKAALDRALVREEEHQENQSYIFEPDGLLVVK